MTAYITLAEAKAWLGIPLSDTASDTIVTDLITVVSEAIDGWTESRFDAPQVTTNERHDGRRQDVILPRGWPLISVQAVYLNVKSDGTQGALLDAENYNHDDVEIRLRGLNLPQQRGYFRIDYTWGYSAVPARVKQATKIGVEGYFRHRARQAVGISSKSKEGESISYRGAWDATAGLPKEAVSLLQSFRRLEWPDGPGGEMATRNV